MQNNNPTLQIETTTAIHTAISYGKYKQFFTQFNILYAINDWVDWLPLSSYNNDWVDWLPLSS